LKYRFLTFYIGREKHGVVVLDGVTLEHKMDLGSVYMFCFLPRLSRAAPAHVKERYCLY
jgi:hypothetical protein